MEVIKQKLEKLYKSGLSMQEISDRTGWSYHQVVYWMDKYNIPRRSRSEATYKKRNPNGDPFKIKDKLDIGEIELKGLGMGLYWGEGDRSNSTSVRLGNVDSRLIKKFIDFLIKICGVKKEKIKYELQMFNDSDKNKAIKFWTKELCIKREQLGKVINYPSRGKGTYKKKNQTGVLTVCCHNKKLKEKIISMLN